MLATKVLTLIKMSLTVAKSWYMKLSLSEAKMLSILLIALIALN